MDVCGNTAQAAVVGGAPMAHWKLAAVARQPAGHRPVELTGYRSGRVTKISTGSISVVKSECLVKKLEEMEKTAGNYRNLMEHTRRLLRAFFNLSQAHRGTSLTHTHTHTVVHPVDCNSLPDCCRDPTHSFSSFYCDLKTFFYSFYWHVLESTLVSL